MAFRGLTWNYGRTEEEGHSLEILGLELAQKIGVVAFSGGTKRLYKFFSEMCALVGQQRLAIVGICSVSIPP